MDPIVSQLTGHYAAARGEITAKLRRYVATLMRGSPHLTLPEIEHELTELTRSLCRAAFQDETARLLAHELTLDIAATALRQHLDSLSG
jgi:hypothetical protein